MTTQYDNTTSAKPAEKHPTLPERGRSISKEDLNALPIRSYEGQTFLVNRREDLADAVASLRKETLLGFDTETRPAFQRGVSYPPALIQLAMPGRVYVFQILQLGDIRPLLDVLEDATILKAGVAITDDLKQLREVYDFRPGGFIEIGSLARGLNIHQTGLRSLAGMFLGFRISKKEQRSNWAKPELTPSQVTYAATDAWVSREIYLTLMRFWGDRPLPEPVDPPGPDQSPPGGRSDKKSRGRRRRRTPGRGGKGPVRMLPPTETSGRTGTGGSGEAESGRDRPPGPRQPELFPPDA